MTDLKPCACGKVPDELLIDTVVNKPFVRIYAFAGCCEWSVVYKTNVDDPEPVTNAIKAWNAAPRPVTCEELIAKLRCALDEHSEGGMYDSFNELDRFGRTKDEAYSYREGLLRAIDIVSDALGERKG